MEKRKTILMGFVSLVLFNLACGTIILTIEPALAYGEAVTIKGYSYGSDGVTPVWIDDLNITNTNTGIEYNQTTIPQVKAGSTMGYQYYYIVTFTNGTHIYPGDTLNYYSVNTTLGIVNNTAGFTWDGVSYVVDYIFIFPTVAKPDFFVEPSYTNISLDDSFTINITVDPAGNEIDGAHYELFFDPSVLNATTQTPGTFLSQDGAPTTVIINEINNTIGKLEYNETRTGVDNGTSTTGVLASITFTAIAPGTCNLNLSDVRLSDLNGTSMGTAVNNGTVTVKGVTSFNISGFVVYSDSAPVLNPNVTITNLNTSEMFSADTNESSNYYHVSTDSKHVSAGNILHINASNDNTTELNHTVTEEELNAGGFVQNITIFPLPKPDLVVAKIPAQLVFANVSNNISAVIKNDGDANASSFNVSLAVNGTIFTKTTVAGLSAGSTTSVNFVWTPAQTGNYTITVNADCNDKIAESNESNNELSETVTVLPPVPDLAVTQIGAYHYSPNIQYSGAWFNLTNSVNVTITNKYEAGPFNVSLYIDGEFLDRKSVPGLGTGKQINVYFNWTPEGYDCMKGGSPKNYSIEAFADSDNAIGELNKTNNNASVNETVCWNGYTADEPLANVLHGKLRGGFFWTADDVGYSCQYTDTPSLIMHYNITLPEGSEVVIARYNLPFTWCPDIPGNVELNITSPDGSNYTLQPVGTYFDRPCEASVWNKVWGNFVFNLTSYICENGVYNITLTTYGAGFCSCSRPIEVIYKNDNEPPIEYWINEGGDVTTGGRRGDGGGLSLDECINNATFPGSIDLSRVVSARLYAASAWAMTSGSNYRDVNVIYFNSVELGRNTYSMAGLHTNAQMGWNVSDVTDYLAGNVNVAGQGDDGDCMMPFLAALVVQYNEEEKTDLIPTDLNVKHNYYDGAWANLDNTVNVTVENNGTVDTGSFNVKLYAKLYADYEVVDTELISNLSAGNSAVVSFLWTPNESEVYDLKAVVDPEDTIAESNETNNEITKTQYVGYNGYMGDKPFTTYAHERHRGELKFTWGNSYYSSKIWPKDSGKNPYNYTVNFNITVPDNATIKLARLYNYWTWSCKGSSGATPEMSVTFAGNELTPDKKYDDIKGWGGYSYPTGTYCYNVSHYISESGAYTAYLENTATDNSLSFCMDGFGLLVVYEEVNGHEIEYWINEGCDMLCTQYASGGLTSEEATATSAFTGTLDISKVKNATLWTVVQSGGNINNILIFNAGNWSGAYDATPYSDLDVDEREVTGCLNSSDNIARIRAAVYPDGDYLVPSNAFLVVEYKDEERPEFDTGHGTYPSISGMHKGTITPRHDIAVRTMYTYPSAGTGGHTEFVELNNETFRISATWDGYQSDYHNITFPHQFTLLANHTYNYTIRTGSYPQIHHTNRLELGNGTIRCHEFIDANDRKYNDSIPAIRLSL